MATNPGLQISLNVKGRSCVVLGGDEEAVEKVNRLLDAGAKVTVIHPTLHDDLRKLTASAKILHRARRFRASDSEGISLAINTLRDDPEFSDSLFELAKKERFLVCSTDQPEQSNVMMPALVKRGHLRLAVSTSGKAPALASRLRQDLEEIFDENFRSFLDWLADLRDQTMTTETDIERRRKILTEAVGDFKVTGSVEYPKGWNKETGGPQ